MAVQKLKRYDRKFYLCPLCAGKVNWICYGATGHALCERSARATQYFKIDDHQKFCEWEGKVRRSEDGRIEITYEGD